MTEPVGLGLVGCGRAAERLYVPALRAVRSARVVGVTDVSAARSTLLAQQLNGARIYDSLDVMLDDPAVEAVVIGTPPATHVPPAREALLSGRWVLIEKPLAETLEHGLWLGELGEALTRRVMMGYNRRFWAPMRRLREVAAQHDMRGASVSLEFSIDVTAWNAITGAVDPLDDLASHYLDALRFVFDTECTHVEAERVAQRAVRLKVGLGNGVEASMFHEHGNWTRERMRVQCNGRVFEARMGSVRIEPTDGLKRTMLDRWDQLIRRIGGGGWTLGRSYVEQLEALARCVRRNEPAQPGYEDGLAGLHSLVAAKRSAAQHGGEVGIDGDSASVN